MDIQFETKKEIRKKRRRKDHKIIYERIRQRKTQKKFLKRKKRNRTLTKRKNKTFTSDRFTKSFTDFIEKGLFLKGVEFKMISKGEDNGSFIAHVPVNFSIITNPDEVLDFLKQLYVVGTYNKTRSIHFDHTNVEEYEIGASALLDVFVINFKEYHRRELKRKIVFSGKLPDDIYIKDKIYVSGIIKQLEADKGINKLIREKRKNLIPLDLIRGGHHSKTMMVSSKLDSGTASTSVINHFNDCLRTQGHELSSKGRNRFSNLIGEAITNCENHAGEFKQWFALGHYYMKPEEDFGEFNLVLFNFGSSIYEQLKNSNLHSSIEQDLKRLTKRHNAWFRKNWDEEVLWTLYSLQEGVSRLKSDEEKGKDRGVGTIRLLEAFQKIGQTHDEEMEPLMSIISGNTYIHFNNKYPPVFEKNIDGTQLKVIAFNKSNDLNEPPDSGNVKKINNYLPGTVISMKFYLQDKYLETIKQEV